MPDYEFVKLDLGDGLPPIYQCIDCGAFDEKVDRVKHYPGCTPDYRERVPAGPGGERRPRP